ncbi:MAG TPA: YfiR/HmsC family protein [Bacteroidales bacterium]|nr:YfiR/HmsC family protein [Bacteroidales bacterium]
MRRGICILLLFVNLCLSSLSIAQTVDRNVAISAYIYNFAKNVVWQNEENITEFHFCIIGNDKAIINEMKTMSQSKTIRGKSIKITNSNTLTETDAIHLIYVTYENREKISDIYNLVEGKNILIVTDRCPNKNNIMINFVNSEDGSLLFEINKSNITGQNITVMPDLILLGGTEVDVSTLYYEGQQTLRDLQKQIESLEYKNNQLYKIQTDIKIKLNYYQDSLKELISKTNEQQTLLDKQKSLLNQRDKEIKKQNLEIQKNQEHFDLLTLEIETQDSEIEKRQEILERQTKEIETKKLQIEEQTSTLKNQNLTINRQRNLMYLMIIIVILVVSLIFAIYKSYRNKQKMNKELERKVQERTNELNVLNTELEERVAQRTAQLVAINKELESFNYSISHDLRAPLRAIYGFSQIISTRHKDSLNEEGKQYIDYVVAACVRMEQLINDLLNFSRLGRKSIELHPVDINEILQEMQMEFKQKIEDIQAKMIIDDNMPVITGDKSLCRQIFINLIDNAITYRRPEVQLVIQISCEETKNSYILSISDNGIGIKKEYWVKIFNIFQRLHSEEEYSGTGIGLATVKKSIELMNGVVEVDSVFGEWTSFIIKFNKKQ